MHTSRARSGLPPVSLRLAALIYFSFATVFAFFVGRNIAVRLRFEDALIVLRYARNLVAGEGFVFNPGERVLGVTTPLHTLLSTVYVALSPENAPALQNLGGLFFLLLEGFLVLLLVRRMGHPYLAFLAALATLNNFNLSYLYFGMEAHLFAFLVLLAFHLYLDGREKACGLVLGLAFLARYDAALAAALIGVGFLVERRKIPWRLVTVFAVTVTPWLVFAQLYFGTILPGPLDAKKDYFPAPAYLRHVFMYYKATYKKLIGLYLPVEFLKAGLSYLFLVPVLVGVAKATIGDRRWILLGVYPFLHVAAYAVIGSDPGFTWHYYVLNPIFYAFFAVGVGEIVRLAWTVVGRPAARHATAVAAVLLLVASLPLAGNTYRILRHRNQMDPHTRQLYAMAGWLEEHYDEETSLLQPSIGVLGWETNFRMIDHAGLVTPGLYFFDDLHATPIAEVIERHAPDLILLSEASRDDVTVFGYRLVRVFEGPLRYQLYERPGIRRPEAGEARGAPGSPR